MSCARFSPAQCRARVELEYTPFTLYAFLDFVRARGSVESRKDERQKVPDLFLVLEILHFREFAVKTRIAACF